MFLETVQSPDFFQVPSPIHFFDCNHHFKNAHKWILQPKQASKYNSNKIVKFQFCVFNHRAFFLPYSTHQTNNNLFRLHDHSMGAAKMSVPSFTTRSLNKRIFFFFDLPHPPVHTFSFVKIRF